MTRPWFSGLPVYYRGLRMRSRLEARFAELLDIVGISWRYEAADVAIGDGDFYRPDFFLPALRTWCETKCELAYAGLDDLARLRRFAHMANRAGDLVVIVPSHGAAIAANGDATWKAAALPLDLLCGGVFGEESRREFVDCLERSLAVTRDAICAAMHCCVACGNWWIDRRLDIRSPSGVPRCRSCGRQPKPCEWPKTTAIEFARGKASCARALRSFATSPPSPASSQLAALRPLQDWFETEEPLPVLGSLSEMAAWHERFNDAFACQVESAQRNSSLRHS